MTEKKRKNYRAGLIGLGYAGFVQLPAIRKIDNCSVVAVCGTSFDKTQRFALENNIQGIFTDWETMLNNQKLDLLILAVPPVTQAKILKKAFYLGINCFCEKPLSADLNSAEELLIISKIQAAFHAVDFIFPEIPCWIRAKGKISSGAIGEIKHACVNWFVETEASRIGTHSWKLNREQGGGVLKNFVSHVLYYIEWMLGEIKYVTCELDEQSPGYDMGSHITLTLISGIRVTVNVRQDAFAGIGHHFSIYGKKGTIHLVNDEKDYVKGFNGTYINVDFNREALRFPSDFNNDADGRIVAVDSLLNRWMKCIENKFIMKPGLAEGVRVQRLLHALEISNASKIISLEI
jgi:predicted dehydrogenase